jgi:hypothetical protein
VVRGIEDVLNLPNYGVMVSLFFEKPAMETEGFNEDSKLETPSGILRRFEEIFSRNPSGFHQIWSE